MRSQHTIVLVVLMVLIACSRNPYKATNRVYKKQARTYGKLIARMPIEDSVSNAPYFVGTTNFSLRKPNYVIIHHTAQDSCSQTLKTFTLARTQVSAHYVICRDGSVFHMLNDFMRAHHAGISRWGNTSDINSSSIGIEIDNNGKEPFSNMQMNSLLSLLGRLKSAYNIPQANFIGHADIAPGRKVDPSRLFSWKMLAESGYGFWYDTTNTVTPPDFNAMQALRIIGYNIKDTAIAIQSYKIHFVPQDSTRIIGDTDRKILYELMKKYQ
jgi:N-acetylmuramoyl-L-alanine amidase